MSSLIFSKTLHKSLIVTAPNSLIDNSSVYVYTFKIENVHNPSNAKSVTELIRPLFNSEDEPFRNFPFFNEQDDVFVFTSNVKVEQFELENLLSLSGYRLLNFTRKMDINKLK
jgi:hypothetical protein